MLIRVVVLFLLFMVVMGMVQKALRPKRRIGAGAKRNALDAMRCPQCKRINLTSKPTPCERPDCGYRE